FSGRLTPHRRPAPDGSAIDARRDSARAVANDRQPPPILLPALRPGHTQYSDHPALLRHAARAAGRHARRRRLPPAPLRRRRALEYGHRPPPVAGGLRRRVTSLPTFA